MTINFNKYASYGFLVAAAGYVETHFISSVLTTNTLFYQPSDFDVYVTIDLCWSNNN
jgi:hypothetical protein